MTEQTVGLKYVPEKDLAHEGIRKVGVGIFIVDLDTHQIWVVKEKKSKNGKNGTGREINDISIPLETRKNGEKIIDNVLGGLAEFRPLQDGEELIWVDGASYQGRHELVSGVVADIVIIGLKNRHDPETESFIDSSEVAPVGWKLIEELQSEPNLRSGVANYLELAQTNNWISNFIEATNDPAHRLRSMGDSFDLHQFIESRDKTDDIG